MKIIKTSEYKTAWYNDPISLEHINSNMNEFFKTRQNSNPDEPHFAVDTRNKNVAISPSAKSAITKVLHALGKEYYQRIPLDEIFGVCKANGVVPLQEDGTEWSGFMSSQGPCGSDNANREPIRMELATQTPEGYMPAKNELIMTICTMASGNLEFVGYLS
jgi:hypothetical protein